MNKPLPPSRTADQFVVRFPDGLRDAIANAAKVSNRSMNAEITERLLNSFSLPPDARQRMEHMEQVSAKREYENASLRVQLDAMHKDLVAAQNLAGSITSVQTGEVKHVVPPHRSIKIEAAPGGVGILVTEYDLSPQDMVEIEIRKKKLGR